MHYCVGVITCDKMTCPSNSIGCSVSVESTKDLANIETIRKCYDEKSKLPRVLCDVIVACMRSNSELAISQC